GLGCEHGQERELSATITLSEGMDCVDLGKDMRCLSRETRDRHILEIISRSQICEYPFHLEIDIFRKTKPVLPLTDPDRSDFARPFVDILKKVTMDGSV